MKRFTIFAVVLTAMLVLATPALAFNGARADYTLSTTCQICHDSGTSKPIYPDWSLTKHASSNIGNQATRSPEGSSCAGCHTSNYDPSKASPSPSYAYNTSIPTPTPTKTTWTFPVPSPFPAQDTGNAAYSELAVGCSSCHYGERYAGGGDPSNTAHAADSADMANADICGQCHSRYAYTVATFANPMASIATPTPGTKALIQPQYAVGFQMLGNPGNDFTALPLSSNLIVPSPGWSPTPNPLATTAAGLMTYWKNAADGSTTIWQQIGHDGSAAQYPEWAGSLHAQSLDNLKAAMGPNPPASCLKCHSADYRIAPAGAKPTGAEAKYGITCVGCHTPHDAGSVKGVWDEEFDAQLVGDAPNSGICVTCHTAELAGATATPGSTVHNTTKEMMDGTGAIGVPSGSPSVHKGKCIQCHMPPTSYSRGSTQLGGNHTMTIIEPGVAAEVSPFPMATPTISGTPVVQTAVMPYSSCSTCHAKAGDPLATYLDGTIADRQATMQSRIDGVTAELVAGAARMGYPAGADDAATIADTLAAIAAKDAADRTASEVNFQKAYTNRTFVENEGSLGIHNYAYATATVAQALEQAQAVKDNLTAISAIFSSVKVVYGKSITISGTVTGGSYDTLVGGQVELWRKAGDMTRFVPIASTYLDGDNADMYSFTTLPKKTSVYRVKFVGNASYEPITSAETTVQVAYRVTLTRKPAVVRKGKRVALSGFVSPVDFELASLYSSGNVQLQKKRAGGSWRNAGTTMANFTSGKFTASKRMTSRGTFYFRATIAADIDHLKGTSNVVKVIVR